MARLTDCVRNELKCVEGPLNVNQTKPNFKMLIDFRQFLYDYVEKVLFKANFFFFCMTEMQRQTTLAHNLNIPPRSQSFSVSHR